MGEKECFLFRGGCQDREKRALDHQGGKQSRTESSLMRREETSDIGEKSRTGAGKKTGGKSAKLEQQQTRD